LKILSPRENRSKRIIKARNFPKKKQFNFDGSEKVGWECEWQFIMIEDSLLKQVIKIVEEVSMYLQ
jgi:CRISPR/Cas system endoribonuclease Cas6 (RAMP superfamily)